MNRRLSRLALMLVVGLLVAACGSAETSGPPVINYGRDVCTQCGMIINEARFASAYELPDGTQKLFDDLGGMIAHQRQAGDTLDPRKTWVHDFETEEWVTADAAYFVPTLAVTTPMGHGILAFSDSERAHTFAAEVDGEVIDWATVMALPQVDGLVGDHHEGGGAPMGDMEMGSDESEDHSHG